MRSYEHVRRHAIIRATLMSSAQQDNERFRTLWPSGLRRWLKAPVRKGVGSNPTGVTCAVELAELWPYAKTCRLLVKCDQRFAVVALLS